MSIKGIKFPPKNGLILLLYHYFYKNFETMSTTFFGLPIQSIKNETNNTVSINFDVPTDLAGSFKFIPGQYLTLKTKIDGQEVRRSYSICSAPYENELTVAVKAIDKGVFSTYATQQLKVGDVLDVMAPMGNFKIEPNAANSKNYIFYAAGSGITPIISMIKSILKVETNSQVQLYYGNKSESETIFKSALDSLAESYSNFNLTYSYSRQASDNGGNGRIDNAKCQEFYDKNQTGINIDGVYACGPEAMIMMVKDFYLAKGLPANQIHFELFTATAPVANESTASLTAVDSKVTVIIDDEEYTFTLNTKGKDILQAAQDKDADVPYSCKGGVCCTCRAKLLEGTVKMDLNYALEADEVAKGFILTCQSHPTSERVIVSFDE
jgi:ring-1,2-phenylacetyl-CoA epoxidase subunit PaaE